MRRFSQFACIDWSGALGARQAGIAVAICGEGDAAPQLVQLTGGWSRAAVLDWLTQQAGSHSDLLIGIDFSPSLPFDPDHGFFPGWDVPPRNGPELWHFVDALCVADAHFAASAFVDHPEASRYFRRSNGRRGDRFAGTTGAFRQVELRCRTGGFGPAQSCFNLVGAAQVGKSSLTGMRVLNRLGGVIPLWPFHAIGSTGPALVEIYTSVAARAAGVIGGSKMRDGAALDRALGALQTRPHGALRRYDDHSTDAILTAAWLRHVADTPRLWSPPGLSPAIASTEGWTFGIH